MHKKYILFTLPKLCLEFDKTKNFKFIKPEFQNYCLSVGRLVNYKAHDLLIKSFYKVKDKNFKLIIVGNGPNYFKLKKLVHSLKMDNIKILTNISNKRLVALYKFADFFCLTSKTRAESFGAVLIEALMFNLPLLTTKVIGSGMSYINIDNYTGIQVDPKIDSISKALNLMHENEPLLKNFKKNTKYRYREFNKNQFTNKLFKMYE